jgi:sec-independent protein translocase protein TatA
MALGPWQLLIILAIVLLLFGGRGKISAIMGDFGKGLRNFKTGMKGPEEDAGEETDVLEEAPKAAKKPAAKKAATKKTATKKAATKKAAAKKANKK